MRSIAKLVLCCTVAALLGCGRSDGDQTVAQGVIWSVEYRLENGKTGGFTRINSSHAVPGGNGSWNVDAHGRLTRDYLFITHPKRKDAGLEVIPASRIVTIHFGDGGIKTVQENQPTPGK